jgi:pyridoxine 4-dehydrogenase
LQRSANILLIPGTSSVGHLRENLAAARLALPEEVLAELDGIGAAG